MDGTVVDVRLDGGSIGAVVPGGTLGPGDPDSTLELDGFLLLPAPADPHAHLDKALSWGAIRPPMGDLRLAIESWHAYSDQMTVDEIADRARAQALTMLAHGTTAIRSHVDLLPGPDPLRGVHALVRVRDELRGLLDLELVTLGGYLTPAEDHEAALAAGVDLVGGAPHLAPDAPAELTRLLEIARQRGVGVDIHTDESLDCDVTLDVLARAVVGWTAPVSAGHCVRLGTLDGPRRDQVIADVLAADVGVIANPITNLYLQGWDSDVATPRGLTAVRALVDAGVRFAAGADNVRDPFNPLGRSDALETAMLLVVAGHLSVDQAYAAVSTGARDVMGLPPARIEPGARAELLAVRGDDLVEVVATASLDRYVLHAGRLVALSETHSRVAAPALLPTYPEAR
ncbi:amidohydrolase family protein [Cellulomonas sp. URHD0024]|uniref:amidohydrolase family protein n=1 Tax=Cellulomonas sp. URHD0024 TaxID=1302620 RepID=UPI00040ECDE8|nr:amidohydrolase family protein [Cellulomonas sp. URHD0024]